MKDDLDNNNNEEVSPSALCEVVKFVFRGKLIAYTSFKKKQGF